MIKKTLAIFSPNQNAYSETFIQAHKKLPYNIRYYYNGLLPRQLEGKESLIKFSTKERIEKKIRKQFNLDQYALLYSLKREKVDCILAEYGPTACETLEIIRFLNLPLVVHFHGHDSSVHWIVEKYKNLYKEVFIYADSIIAVSRKMKEALISLGCPEKKIFVCIYGTNDIFLLNKPDYNNRQFVSVGRFTEKKAPYLTILAFKKVLDKNQNISLKMIGEGELLTACKKLSFALGLSKNIDFLGIKSMEEIKNIFENSVAFIQHSIIAEDGDSEGTPVAIIEAQAASLPVISTIHAGIPDVVIHNETGLLSNEGDTDEMANNIFRILNENNLASQLGSAAKNRILGNFTMEKNLNMLESIINKAMRC